MNDNKQRTTETLGQAARRLLAELEARKRPSGETPEQIPYPAEKRVPVGLEKADGEMAGEEFSYRSPSATSTAEGKRSGFLIANDNAGRVAASEAEVNATMHRPASNAGLYRRGFTGLESSSKTSTARWKG